MRYRIRKTDRKRLLKKNINLIVCVGITITLGFGIKGLFFDKKELAQASQENFELPGHLTDEASSPSPGITESNVIDDVNNEYNMDNPDSVDSMDSNDNSKDAQDVANGNDTVNADEDQNEDENGNGNKGEMSLDHSVFIGDSITEALSYYKFVNYSHVIADKGGTAKKAISQMDKVVELKPDRIFIMFGLNDILSVRNVDSFINNYTNLLHILKERLPDADIYIQSILPVDSKLVSSKLSLSNSEIHEYNEGLKILAQQENVYYLNVASITQEYGESLHEPDGIHYKSKFCTLWLEYIMKNIKN